MNIMAEDAQPFESDDEDPHDQIAQLETQLEELAESMARCRKIKLMSQVSIAGGGTWMLAVAIGLIALTPIAMMAAISAVIGGTVMYGSNTTTSRELDAAMKDAEVRRAELIGRLQLRVVGELE
ncbi:MAG TPA: hypothetical protein VKP67_20410 [Xanthobacteraceae bacterium]|nr:hypothetical protein [Xanthobacteraceae bacterium]